MFTWPEPLLVDMSRKTQKQPLYIILIFLLLFAVFFNNILTKIMLWQQSCSVEGGV